jgi:hypothetical protein
MLTGDAVRRERVSFALAIVFILASVSNALAMNCVQFVRAASDFDISGNAWSWWYHAAGLYDRGNAPRAGAVLVFQRTGRIPAGHVALISGVIDGRTVLIDHANWSTVGGASGHVDLGVVAIDCSRHHDWSAVCVWNKQYQSFGRPYPTNGFIYPEG